MKILYVLEYYYPHIGGVETLFKTLAEGMALRGNEVRVFTLNFNNSLKKYEIIKGVKVYRIKLLKPKRFFFTFFSFPFIFKYAKDVDIIHSSTYGGTFSASLVSFLLKKKSVLSVHEIWMEKWKRVPFISKIQRFTGSFQEWILLNLPFDLKVTESFYTLKRLKEINIQNNRVIQGGVEIPKNLKGEKGGENVFKFCYFGRPGHWKGLDTLIYAYKELIKIKNNTKLILILSEEPKKEYKEIIKLINLLGLKNSLVINNPLPKEELFKFLLQMDCIVIPSLSEGFGFSALEACGLEIPIISSNAGSLPEVVSGKCLFFEKGNFMDLKEKMEKALEGKWEYIPKKEFPISKFIDDWERVYKNLF